MTKETKTESELQAMILDELRKFPECAHMTGIGIKRSSHRSWYICWLSRDDAMSIDGCRVKLEPVVAKLRERYDLENTHERRGSTCCTPARTCGWRDRGVANTSSIPT
jgi:hypothetical protein